MTVTSPEKKWLDELAMELRLREVSGPAIGDAVASARELLADTGQGAHETFGSARDYAAALELPRASDGGALKSVLWTSLLGLLAFLLFAQATAALALEEPLLASPGQLALLSVPVILSAFLPLYLALAIRRRWVLVALVAVCAASGVLSALLAPSTPAEAWLAVDPIPWLIASGAMMVLLSIWGTVAALRRGDADDGITLPLEVPSAASKRRAMAFVIASNWLFPCFAVLVLVGTHLLTM
ncbi:hypothetical protein [Salinibacterium sp. ZJ454]|uniref:hypothetical protein n=1 Tax=Salinibacterium sp. ZJ454 TaxID=2708339 RepID=UPI00141F4A2F|nr:hypothetical protein [Salinibacterium sp. ZJ454]